jgi:hypothetical protein
MSRDYIASYHDLVLVTMTRPDISPSRSVSAGKDILREILVTPLHNAQLASNGTEIVIGRSPPVA